MNRIGAWWQNRKALGYTLGGVLLVMLVGTLLVLALAPGPRRRVVFWFPDTAGAHANAEWRYLPRRETRREFLELYLAEMLLGPVRMGSAALVPRGVGFRIIALGEEGRLFLDLSPENLIGREEEVDINRLFELIEKNVLHNFRFVKNIIITVGGDLPNVPRFSFSPLTKQNGAL
ncbi:hypothetical protein [Alkalispirochaeta americana]|nr:hypothetical protein [Alkalispirochaeta americana]